MSNFVDLEIHERGCKVDLTHTTPPIRISTKGWDLDEDPRVNGESAMENGDDEDVEEEDQHSTSQLTRWNREHGPYSIFPSSECIIITDEGKLESFEKI